MTQAYTAVLNEGTIPEGWKESKTVMIPKTGKPTAREHRPIALTNVGYKIFMTLVKSKLGEHLERNRLISDYQAGFTGGRRLEENLFIVRYCIEETFRFGKRLIVVAIDFEKAFDNVDRVALIRALMYYKCDNRLIDVVLDLYVGDRTEVWRNGILVADKEVTGGFRQGCTGSPLLFVMVVNIIINSVVESRISMYQCSPMLMIGCCWLDLVEKLKI